MILLCICSGYSNLDNRDLLDKWFYSLQVYSEITFVGKNPSKYEQEDIYRMPLLLATIYESARLMPLGPLLQRCSLKHGEILLKSPKLLILYIVWNISSEAVGSLGFFGEETNWLKANLCSLHIFWLTLGTEYIR